MDYNFLKQPIMPGQAMNPGYNPMPQQPMPYMAPMTPPPVIEAPSYGFNIVPDEVDPTSNTMLVPTANMLPEPAKRKRGRPRKNQDGVEPLEIIRPENNDVIAATSTINTYEQTSMMLEEAIQQLDMVAGELKEEFDNVRMNRNMRNRGMMIKDLGDSIGSLINSKVSAIRELNNAISRSNDLDYKKEKDLRQMQADMASDDKHIMDLYTAFIKNQNNPTYTPNLAMPTAIQAAAPSVDGAAIIRSPIVSANPPAEGEVVDIGYLNYLSRLSPEQNAMFYENDPNVQTVVVFDHSTGKKFFQVMNTATGQVVPNMPILDQRFMDDTYLDMKSMTARNSNLNQSFPIVEINKSSMSVESQY